ncbi:MAG: hypothetical protein A3E38_03230 [Candidatus Moranbacteria bacterium RIFCSPHIGHO2_12_FULL_54_9]|nr:MAG: hypothetical protein A2878_02740 [Candidatus Moranbacteria bacterium RIFCSPHIGHO2_01_FULL_54_31]OGI24660.1 MAG: hypothetical protein A3E38_03230 [Candidatus Moranbacteria bacterium RIFCSPHIGHO2_12_FULL_54_9]
MQNKKKHIRSPRLRKLLKLHTVITAISLGVYFLAAFFDPGFLSYDLRQKYHALADDTIAITATVLGPPEQPVVTATAECNVNTGVLSVLVDWADDTNTSTYDIDRDSLPLVTGLLASAYSDTNVVVGTTYEYAVTANGPMGPGFAASSPVTVTMPAECVITATAPSVNIMSFGGRGVGSYDGTPSVSDRRPVFSGTTNMPDAIIQVAIGPVNSLIASFVANANGYWEWKPPFGLSTGTQTFTVTAIDPDDATRQTSASLKFGIKKRDDDANDSKQEAALPTGSGTIQPGQRSPVDFSLAVENPDKKVWQGEPVDLFLLIESISLQYNNANIPIRFSIVDAKGDAVISVMHEELLRKGREIRRVLETPSYIAAGTYSLRAEILFDQVNVSRADTFLVTELPLISIGGGAFITYAEIIRNLGWITLTLLVLLLLWLFLFVREYGMSLHAVRHITEQQLKKAGFLTKRKGVAR